MRYAIGEILLVVIGILIALQINAWNETKKLEKRELILLNELKSNLEANMENLEEDIKIQTKSISSFDYILDIVNNEDPYNDSIPSYLQIVNFAPEVVLTASSFETLKSIGLEIIQMDTLRMKIIILFEVVYPTLMQETKRIEDQIWPSAVNPLYQKHFRNDNGKWIPNDYIDWIKDKEFFNMISFRKELRKASTLHKIRTTNQTLEVIQLIEKELEKRKIN